MTDTPFFPSWRRWLGPLTRAAEVRTHTLSELEKRFRSCAPFVGLRLASLGRVAV